MKIAYNNTLSKIRSTKLLVFNPVFGIVWEIDKYYVIFQWLFICVELIIIRKKN